MATKRLKFYAVFKQILGQHKCRHNFKMTVCFVSVSGCLSVSLKGRPRKRRGRDGDGADQQSRNHSESWGDRTKARAQKNSAYGF